MSANFIVTGPESLLAIAACGQTTGRHGVEDDADENVTFAFGIIRRNVTFDTPHAAAAEEIPGEGVSVSVQRTFTTAGTYRYHCTIHQGKKRPIVVQ